MNVFYHFSSVLRSNTYLIGPEQGGDAILIDPGEMDGRLLRLVESNGLYVRSILITLARPDQVHGVKTLLKIYDAKLYGNSNRLYDCRCRKLSDGDQLFVSGYKVEVINLVDVEMGPLIYRIENLVFTGPLITAGNVVSASDRRNRAAIAAQLDERILSLTDDVLILPGSGPPSSVRAERFLREAANG